MAGAALRLIMALRATAIKAVENVERDEGRDWFKATALRASFMVMVPKAGAAETGFSGVLQRGLDLPQGVGKATEHRVKADKTVR
jgi:hypothetical protein